MKKVLILFIICTLSSCGLFKKKSSQVDKKEEVHRIDAQISSQSESQEQTKVVESKKTNEQSITREEKNLNSNTTLEADEISIDKEGNIKAKGGVKMNNTLADKGVTDSNAKKEAEEKKNTAVNKSTSEEVKESNFYESELRDYSKDSSSEPSGSGILWMWFGGAVFVIGIFWYFWMKKK